MRGSLMLVIANILFLCSGVALFVFHFIKRNRALRDIVGKRSRGLRKMLSARRLDRGDQPVDVDPDAEKKRRASMEEPDVEIFINPIVMKRYERGERWNKIRKQVFMPGMAISALRRAAGRGGGGGGEAKSTVKSRPVLSRKHSGRRIGRGKGWRWWQRRFTGGRLRNLRTARRPSQGTLHLVNPKTVAAAGLDLHPGRRRRRRVLHPTLAIRRRPPPQTTTSTAAVSTTIKFINQTTTTKSRRIQNTVFSISMKIGPAALRAARVPADDSLACARTVTRVLEVAAVFYFSS